MHSISPALGLSTWGNLSVPCFKKKGIRKNISAWGGLKEFLPQIFPLGGLTKFLEKTDFVKMKYGFKSLISKFDLALC